MLSKNKIKFIRSLEQKKNRRQENAFIAEGRKTVGDLLLAGFQPLLIVHTEEWKSPISLPRDTEVMIVSDEELRKSSLLLHPQQVIAILKIPETHTGLNESLPLDNLVLCLDGVQDPGNLGTIIRTADWFGIKHIVCSQQTVDAFSPKVVQATMGSIARVSVHYTDLTSFLTSLPEGTPVYGTFLDGKNLYHEQLKPNGVIIMGNEGNGISPEIARHVTHRLLIPPYPADSDTAESLNVSIATAIVCAEFRRINFVNNS